MGAATTFSTDGLPEPMRGARFTHHMDRWFQVRVELAPSEARALDVQMQGFRGERLRFAELRFSPHLTRFGGVRTEGSPPLLVSLLKSGAAEVWQDGRGGRVEAGEMVIIDPTRPFTIDADAMEATSIYVAPSMFELLDPRARLLTGMPLDGRGTAGLFRTLAAEATRLAPELADAQADGLADLLAMGLRSAVQAHEAALTGVEQGAALQRSKVRGYALANLADPELSPERIARRFGLSVRRIHQLFAGEGRSLMRWVWTERLAMCRAWLADPAYRDMSVSEIAYAWGFSDSAHFSRAYRDAFGRTPSAERAAARPH